jgi:hypothetical protein
MEVDDAPLKGQPIRDRLLGTMLEFASGMAIEFFATLVGMRAIGFGCLKAHSSILS